MPEIVRERDKGDYADARAVAHFLPDPKDMNRFLEVLSWLSWLRRENDGARDVRIITARAFGAPWWKLAMRYGKSDDTIRRWHDAAIAMITVQHWRDVDRLWM